MGLARNLCVDLIRVRGFAGVRAAIATGDVTEVMEGKKGGLRGSLNKVVLAYSGGLDTSVIVPWLR